ncbi:MAG: hypothetical protein Q7S21_02455 [archaeon]|nr:hypothetical protein [archaeon]
MPTKPLPQELIERLKKVGSRLRLRRMKVIDHRKRERSLSTAKVEHWGRRVRQMNVSKSFPQTELVLKYVHDRSAKKTIEIVQQRVRKHNESFNPKRYVLSEPIAYAIAPKIIAMAKTDAPSVEEILEDKTERGQAFINELKSKLKVNPSIAERKLKRAFNELFRNTQGKIKSGNVLVLGYESGKIVFIPLVDIF